MGGEHRCCLKATLNLNLNSVHDVDLFMFTHPLLAYLLQVTSHLRCSIGCRASIEDKTSSGTSFMLSPQTFLLLLEGQADFSFFGTLSLPSLETMNQAPPDVIDRLNAIKEVDLTVKKVGFTVAGERPMNMDVAPG